MLTVQFLESITTGEVVSVFYAVVFNPTRLMHCFTFFCCCWNTEQREGLLFRAQVVFVLKIAHYVSMKIKTVVRTLQTFPAEIISQSFK